MEQEDQRRLTQGSSGRVSGNNTQTSRRSRVLGALLPALLSAALLGACTGHAASSTGSEPLDSNASGQPSAVAPLSGPPQPVAEESMAASSTQGPVPRVPPLQPPAYASRVAVVDLGIDLPVISGDLQPPPNYPLCDVAAYVTRFSQPYEDGVTYISAHAQRGMFEPLLKASEEQDGQALIGMPVDVYTNDGRRFTYLIDRVIQHAVDYAVLNTISLEERTLVLQTSEGPYGTIEKLQVVASLLEEATAEIVDAAPEPRPRDCRPPELGGPAQTQPTEPPAS